MPSPARLNSLVLVTLNVSKEQLVKIMYVSLAAALAVATAGCNNDGGDGTPGTISVRVAHLSPDAPAVDFCLKKGSGDFSGPVLKGLGITQGISYTQVTKYLDLEEGKYTARLVAPNAADCATSLAGLPDYQLPDLGDGTYATVAAIGLLDPASDDTAFTLKPYVDESTVAPNKVALRFVHTSPGTPPVDFGLGSGGSFTPLFTNITYPGVASNQGIDSLGYLITDPIANATVSVRASGTTTDVLRVTRVSVPADAIATVYAIGKPRSLSTPVRALICVDTAAPVGALSDCSVQP